MARKKGGYVAPQPQGPKSVTYIGMFPRVWVPEAGMHVAQSETVEVPGDLADRLLEQPANWSEGRQPKPQADEPEVDSTQADEPDPEEEGPEEESE